MSGKSATNPWKGTQTVCQLYFVIFSLKFYSAKMSKKNKNSFNLFKWKLNLNLNVYYLFLVTFTLFLYLLLSRHFVPKRQDGIKERNASGACIAEIFLVEIAYDCASWKSSNFWFIERISVRELLSRSDTSLHFIRVWSLDVAISPPDVQFEDPFMLSSHFRQPCAISHGYGIIRQWLACEA